MNDEIIRIILEDFPCTEGIYLFGSAAAGELSEESDIDIAVLLPHEKAKETGSLCFTDTWSKLESALKKHVDLVNLRIVSTVFQKEIITAGICIYQSDEYITDAFEMIVISLYGKLNEERAAIISDFYRTGKAYKV